MIKKTLYFGNPAYLSLRLGQLVIRLTKEDDGLDSSAVVRTIPIEDIGVVVLDHKQITITQALMESLLDNNCALVTCGSNHLPAGLMLPLYGNTVQNERFRQQLDASVPLKKQLWQQTIQGKIANQAAVLEKVTGRKHPNMLAWVSGVKSGDPENLEARAAAYYWKNVFPDNPEFVRGGKRGILMFFSITVMPFFGLSLQGHWFPLDCYRHWGYTIIIVTMPIAWQMILWSRIDHMWIVMYMR